MGANKPSGWDRRALPEKVPKMCPQRGANKVLIVIYISRKLLDVLYSLTNKVGYQNIMFFFLN